MKLASRKTLAWFSSLIFCATGLALSGCDVRFDDGATDGDKSAALDQLVRYRAATCSEKLSQALSASPFSPSASTFAASVAKNFQQRAQAFGPAWPVSANNGQNNVKQAMTPASEKIKETLPPPQLKVFTQQISDTSSLVRAWDWCAKQQLQDAYVLARIPATAALNKSQSLPEGTKELLQERDLSKLAQLAAELWGAGYESKQELAHFLSLEPTNFQAESTVKTVPLALVKTDWEDVKLEAEAAAWTDLNQTPTAVAVAQKTAQSQGTLGRDSLLGQAIVRGDALRAWLEELTARLGTVKQKNEQVEIYTPAIRRQLQNLVAGLGVDPRQAAYSGNLGVKADSVEQGRQQVAKQLLALQYQYLLTAPNASRSGLEDLLTVFRPLLSDQSVGTVAFPGLTVANARLGK